MKDARAGERTTADGATLCGLVRPRQVSSCSLRFQDTQKLVRIRGITVKPFSEPAPQMSEKICPKDLIG
jgi:hypothetical protein